MEQDTQQYGRCQICAQQEKSRLLRPKNAHSSGTNEKSRAAVIAKKGEPPGLRLGTLPPLYQLCNGSGSHRIATNQAKAECGCAGTPDTKQRPHEGFQRTSTEPSQAGGDQKRGEHKKRKQRRDQHIHTEGNPLPRRCDALLWKEKEEQAHKEQARAFYHCSSMLSHRTPPARGSKGYAFGRQILPVPTPLASWNKIRYNRPNKLEMEIPNEEKAFFFLGFFDDFVHGRLYSRPAGGTPACVKKQFYAGYLH